MHKEYNIEDTCPCTPAHLGSRGRRSQRSPLEGSRFSWNVLPNNQFPLKTVGGNKSSGPSEYPYYSFSPLFLTAHCTGLLLKEKCKKGAARKKIGIISATMDDLINPIIELSRLDKYFYVPHFFLHHLKRSSHGSSLICIPGSPICSPAYPDL